MEVMVRFTLKLLYPDTHCTRDWEGPSAEVDAVVNRKFPVGITKQH
jgi:hypothetical protein